MAVKFLSMDLVNKTATFEVNSNVVNRPIAEGVTDETIKDHLVALAQGLAIELPEDVAQLTVVPFKVGEEIDLTVVAEEV